MSFLEYIEIPDFCGTDTESACPNTQPAGENLDRRLNAPPQTLLCKPGYATPQGAKSINADCVEKTGQVGVWECSNKCEG